MAERALLEVDQVAELLAGQLGPIAEVVALERRSGFDLYRAAAAGRWILVKVGPRHRLAREAENLRCAHRLVGTFAPALLAFVTTSAADATAVLAMQYVPGQHLEPGGLSQDVWNALVHVLRRLHGHVPHGAPLCAPLAGDFITLSVGEQRYASLPQLRPLLSAEAERAPDLDAEAALALFDALSSAITTCPGRFRCAPRLVHGDLWPENVLVHRQQCWLVDWAWLKSSDYALDLANLKLILDWVWPSWTAQLAFERLLRRYATEFDDPGLVSRMAVLLPAVSLIHLVQFGQAGLEDPYNAWAMRACLATARRDAALWLRKSQSHRLAYAMTHPCVSEYGAWDEARPVKRAGAAAARLVRQCRSRVAHSLVQRTG